MSRGNPEIATHGARRAAEIRQASHDRIAAAKTRIEQRILRGGFPDGGKLTVAAVLEEAGLNRLYLEGKAKQADKQRLKEWLERARRQFRPAKDGSDPARGAAPPSTRLEARFEVLKTDFLRLQNAYVAAHMTYEDARTRIRTLEDALRSAGLPLPSVS